MQAARTDMHSNVGVLDELPFTPLSVAPDVADVAVNVRKAETQFRPFYIIAWHFIFSFFGRVAVRYRTVPDLVAFLKLRRRDRLGSPF